MKIKLLLVLLLIIGAFCYFYVTKKSREPVLGVASTHSDTETKNSETILKELKVSNYKVYVAMVDSKNIFLEPNFERKEVANNLFSEDDCKVLINGGFYSEKHLPIGLFISNYEILGKYQTNNLFNGIFSINDMATPRITEETPKDPLIYAIQTGPILIANNSISKLSLARDKNARRMVAAVTGKNELYFMAIFDPDNTFYGPRLMDLPTIISEIEDKAQIDFADAINLDGGSASAFYANDIKLSESSPIGSYFCEK